jgi:hypothetical protein
MVGRRGHGDHQGGEVGDGKGLMIYIQEDGH